MAVKRPKLFIEHVDVAWKQVLDHVNEFPSGLSNIDKVQDIIKTYSNDSLPKTDNIEEFLQRKPRYEFNVFIKLNKYRKPAHHFIFDNEEDAKKAHRKCMCIMINELIEPYRKLVAAGKKLTEQQLAECEKIQNLLPGK